MKKRPVLRSRVEITIFSLKVNKTPFPAMSLLLFFSFSALRAAATPVGVWTMVLKRRPWGLLFQKRKQCRHYGSRVNLRKMRSKRCILFNLGNVEVKAVYFDITRTPKECTLRHNRIGIWILHGTCNSINGLFMELQHLYTLLSATSTC